MLRKSDVLILKLEELRQEHHYCRDCFFSCPLDESGCCDPDEPEDECNCGADEHNAKIDALIAWVREYITE